MLGSGLAAGWQPTDHIFLTVPEISCKHYLQSYPFTIASRAPSSENLVSNLSFIIRAQDGFSCDLLQYAKAHKEAHVCLDGSYGSQHAVELLQDSDVNVIIAGGSGIAVTWPLVWAVLDADQQYLDLESSTRKTSRKRILFI